MRGRLYLPRMPAFGPVMMFAVRAA